MNVLFNREGDAKASTELKELLNFIDVDIHYKKIKGDILSATREVIDLVGRDIYNIAYNDYNSKEDAKTQLVYYMRYPIAINAYRMFAPNNDIAHTSNGRKMRQTDNEKQAFEWMIDRDNEMLERKYYRALDDLLHYLEENEAEWKESDAYKKLQESIFKTTDEFNEHFTINSRLLLMKLQPGIKQCLRNEIKVRIGADVLQNLLSGEPENEELYYEVKQACACYAMSWAMPRLSLQLFPQGLLQNYVGDSLTTQAKQVPAGNYLSYAKEYFDKDFKQAVSNIETILKAAEPFDETEMINEFFSGKNYLST